MFFCVFLSFLMYFRFFRVLIIPQWLIQVPGRIPICFGSFLELFKNRKTLDLFTSFFMYKYLKYKKLWKRILEIILFISQHLNNISKFVETTRHQNCKLLLVLLFFFKLWWSKNNSLLPGLSKQKRNFTMVES